MSRFNLATFIYYSVSCIYMPDDKVRITFSCSKELRDKLTERSNLEGIPRSQLIVELIESALSGDPESSSRDATINRFLFDMQKRLADLEAWKREIGSWIRSNEVNTQNLEETVAHMLTDEVLKSGIDTKKKPKKDRIPKPEK